MAFHPFARIAVFALAARPAAGLALDRRAAMRWSAGASAGLVAEHAFADDAPPAAAPTADAPAAPAAEPKPAPAKLFDVTLPFKGKDVPLSKFRGDAHLVVNIKMDDPVAGARRTLIGSRMREPMTRANSKSTCESPSVCQEVALRRG